VRHAAGSAAPHRIPRMRMATRMSHDMRNDGMRIACAFRRYASHAHCALPCGIAGYDRRHTHRALRIECARRDALRGQAVPSTAMPIAW
jgi:hypothetical protein